MNELFLELDPEFNIDNNKKYKIKAIKDYTIYIKKIRKYLPNFCYFIFLKDYSKEKISRNSFL